MHTHTHTLQVVQVPSSLTPPTPAHTPGLTSPHLASPRISAHPSPCPSALNSGVQQALGTASTPPQQSSGAEQQQDASQSHPQLGMSQPQQVMQPSQASHPQLQLQQDQQPGQLQPLMHAHYEPEPKRAITQRPSANDTSRKTGLQTSESGAWADDDVVSTCDHLERS